MLINKTKQKILTEKMKNVNKKKNAFSFSNNNKWSKKEQSAQVDIYEKSKPCLNP